MLPRLATLIWRLLALLALVAGVAGIVLPGVPTVAFLLLSAWCAGRGWPALETWLLEHPRYGGSIRDWRERGAIPRRAKWAASLMMLVSGTVVLALPSPYWLRVLLPPALACVALWIWRRPET